MDSFQQLTNRLLHIVVQLGDLLMAAILAVELWLRGIFARAGLPPMVQTILLVALAALLIVSSWRLFGGLLRIAVVLILLLIGLHILRPVLPG
ncbi:MAG TPA: hypothetical protein PLD10_21465 [Rhodopila sp.]|nr:hypothetical protein [Rhodopila sp.]